MLAPVRNRCLAELGRLWGGLLGRLLLRTAWQRAPP